MEKSSVITKLVSLVIISMLMSSPQSGAITCDEVKKDLLPCVPYILIGGQLPGTCCGGIKTIINQANTTAERQNVCTCLKGSIPSLNNEQFQRVADLPGKCSVFLGFNITRDIDCSKVK